MIDINVTLLIQAVHFAIAYLLIRTFILKPILQVIYQKERAHNDIISLLNRRKEQVTLQEQEKKQQWRNCQKYFALHTPDLHHPLLHVYRLPSSAIVQPTFTASEIKEQTKKLENHIVETWRTHAL